MKKKVSANPFLPVQSSIKASNHEIRPLSTVCEANARATELSEKEKGESMTGFARGGSIAAFCANMEEATELCEITRMTQERTVSFLGTAIHLLKLTGNWFTATWGRH